ncbi:PLP-dependent aminotransferase family protein [Clostridium hydrogeniformans]|uniref:aminotransferase-like domain-containing protein n=1 Tax=Clostridium hydrogeniformans TaxID=349933 RepID=UPI00068E13E1|nr:PLP-dependent aminotransferase family protein [Clostridium hydrogeniformans]
MENKYELIIDYVEKEIKSGNFKAKLPSIRALAIKFNCSNSTVIRAYSELEKKSLIYSMPKSGYFVLENKLFTYKTLDKDKFNFSSGEPCPFILPVDEFQNFINTSINKYKNSLFGYGYYEGFSPLKTTLCKMDKDKGISLDEDNLFFCNGAQQALSIISLMKFPNNKNGILIENPSYNIYLGWLKINNSKVYTIARTESGIDMDLLEDIFKNGNIKFFYTIPRLHNPLGTSYSEEIKQNIIELANKYDVYIVEDDYLSDLNDVNNKPLKYYDTNDRVIYLKSFSKILLPGIRVASTYLPNSLKEHFREFKTFLELQSNILFQSALNDYILSGAYDTYINSLKKHYGNKMKQYNEYMGNNNIDLYYTSPVNGLFSYLKFPKELNLDNLINTLKANNILVRDTKYFYYNKESYNNSIRLSFAKINPETMEEGMNLLFTIIESFIKTNDSKVPKLLEI